MTRYTVTGMSCAACAARVEKAVSYVPGVSECAVNLLTGSMITNDDADCNAVIKAVIDAGYGAMLENSEILHSEESIKHSVKSVRNRLIYSILILICLMYISMGRNMLGLILPFGISDRYGLLACAQLLLCTIVIIINRAYFINGWKGITSASPNMDSLVALGAGISYIYSILNTYRLISAGTDELSYISSIYRYNLYFESSAMILTLITVGKLLESISKGKTTSALKELINLSPQTAFIESEGVEKEVPAETLKAGDVFILKPGFAVPADGTIIYGSTSLNEASISGEGLPVDKTIGDHVISGTINCDGYVKVRADKVGEETLLSGIIRMVSDANTTKAPVQRIADKVSGVFVPVVIAAAIITTVIWFVIGQSAGFSLSRGIAVLVISCPCALGLATPVAIMVSSGIGAKNGILYKNASALEMAGNISTVAFDKTGTVTMGTPEVFGVFPADGITEERFIEYAAGLEHQSEHPLAVALIRYAESKGIEIPTAIDFSAIPGKGVKALVDNDTICAGNMKYISDILRSSEINLQSQIHDSISGITQVYFSLNDNYLGSIAFSDTIRSDSSKAINQLKKMGIRTVMLTGDSKSASQSVKDLLEIDELYAEVLPNEKAKIITVLSIKGKTAMVGDGINDAPALTASDLGIAIGAGSDIAMDAADIVLVNSRLTDTVAAIRLGRMTLKTIKENLFWAFLYNCIGIPIAAGLFINSLGLTINPMIAAACMSLSSIFVVTNALRLYTKDIYSTSKDKYKSTYKENEVKDIMNITIHIEGMMCPHCEARVRNTLNALPGVIKAEVSYVTGEAVVLSADEVPQELLISEVEKQGYKVLSVN